MTTENRSPAPVDPTEAARCRWEHEKHIRCPDCAATAAALTRNAFDLVLVPALPTRPMQWVFEAIERSAYASYAEAWNDMLMAAGATEPSPVAGELSPRIRALLARCADFIDTTTEPGYPAGADLADEIEAILNAPQAPQQAKPVESALAADAEELASWLDNKYRRHGELEDHRAADLIRELYRKIADTPQQVTYGSIAERAQAGKDAGWWAPQQADAREIIEQLVACHDEPSCPAVTMALEWLAAAGGTAPEMADVPRRREEPVAYWVPGENLFCAAEPGQRVGGAWAPLFSSPGMEDENEAIDLLDDVFSAYEDGAPCTDTGDDDGSFIGNAVRLDDETFHRCVALLERRRPRPAADSDTQVTQGEKQP